MSKKVSKLHPAVEQVITLTTVRDKLYEIQDALSPWGERKPISEVKAMLAQANEILASIDDTSAQTETEMEMGVGKSEVSITPAMLAEWSVEQIDLIAKAETDEDAGERYAVFRQVMDLAKAHWELEGSNTKPLVVTISEAYVGTFRGAKKMDVTATSEQSTKTVPLGAVTKSTTVWPSDMSAKPVDPADRW